MSPAQPFFPPRFWILVWRPGRVIGSWRWAHRLTAAASWLSPLETYELVNSWAPAESVRPGSWIGEGAWIQVSSDVALLPWNKRRCHAFDFAFMSCIRGPFVIQLWSGHDGNFQSSAFQSIFDGAFCWARAQEHLPRSPRQYERQSDRSSRVGLDQHAMKRR